MKTKILILDDQEHIRNDLSTFLGRKGYEILSASNITKADDIINNNDFDFAIIDLQIDAKNEFNGIKVIERINNKDPNVKIIVLSAHLNDQEEKDILNKVKVAASISKGSPENYITSVIKKLEELK